MNELIVVLLKNPIADCKSISGMYIISFFCTVFESETKI